MLDAAVFEAIFKKDIRTLGAAIAEAKQTLLANGDAYFDQISDTFLLFGDPATALKLPLPHIPTEISATKQDGQVTVGWQAVLDCNDNPVSGYNVYRAASAAGPFSKINTQLITDTVFVDTDSGATIAGSSGGSSDSGYYSVSAVDDAGIESAQSLAVSPASINSVGSAAAGAAGCFIGSLTNQKPLNIGWLVVIFMVVLTIVKGVRCQCSGVSPGNSDT